MEPPSPPPDKAELKSSFRKPTGDSASRKYRRHSPASKSDSSSSGGSPGHERSHSPLHSMEDKTRAASDQRRRDTEKKLERDSGRNRSSRGYDSQKHSERYSHGNGHDYRRHDDHSRHRRHADEDNRNYLRSMRSVRESRNDGRSDYIKNEKMSDRYRDNWRTVDNHSKDKNEISEHKIKEREPIKEYDTVDTGSKQPCLSRDYDDISGQDPKTERESGYSRKDYHRSPKSKNYHDEEFRSAQERESGATLRRESEKSSKKANENLVQKRKLSEREAEKQREKHTREQEFQTERRSLFSERVNDGRNEEDKASDSVGKQSFSLEPKASQLEHGVAANDLSVSGSKPAKETHEKVNHVETMNSTTNNAGGTNDVNSAKVAALKAAELVNKNLVGFGGTGYLSTDQKKKLLWGNKKNTSIEASSSRWDSHMFEDRDRQEKFNRLMGVKGNAAAESRPDGEDGNLQAKKQEELDTDLEKQYTAGLRRRDGRTVGLGL